MTPLAKIQVFDAGGVDGLVSLLAGAASDFDSLFDEVSEDVPLLSSDFLAVDLDEE